MWKICRYIFVLLLTCTNAPLLHAQTLEGQAAEPQPTKGIQYVPEAEKSAGEAPLFAGVSVSGDVAGWAMTLLAPYGQLEAAARVNLRERFFPTLEVGWGISDHTDESTSLHFKTNAPYFRIGCDYNFASDKLSGNRIFGGLRYAFTTFNYDLSGPDIVDPNWGTSTPFSFSGLHGNVHWCELVFGLEAKIWSIFHLGWTVRYRLRMKHSADQVGAPWYVPGFGKNDTSTLGGTFNIVLDI